MMGWIGKTIFVYPPGKTFFGFLGGYIGLQMTKNEK
jgi:hypothetical protein